MANKKIAILSYEFMFDPSNTWAHVSQFEGDFAAFLKQHGLEAQVMDSIDSRDRRRILFIRPAKTQVGVMGKTQSKMTNPQDVVKKYTNPNMYQGGK